MLEFLRRNQVLLGSGLFLALSFALITANRDGRRRVDPLGWVFLEVLRPLQSATTTTSSQLGGLWRRYVALVGVEDENERLRERLHLLEAESHRAREVEAQSRRLQKILDFQAEIPAEVVTARVTGKDASGWSETFTVDRGERDGVQPGMAVVCAEGVVGRIAQASPHAARVLVVSDHNSGVDALVQRTRARGIVEGAVSGVCSMKYIKRSDEIEVNDVVVTSGLDGIFPKGILIGRVSGVTRKDFGLFQVAEVMPAVDFKKLEEVVVITTPPNQVNEALADAAAEAFTPIPTEGPTPTPTRVPSAAPTRKGTPRPAPRPSPTVRPS